jgi:hypothetical protein
MPMHNGETVGDMIVRHRKEALADPRRSAKEKAGIRSRFTPRSLSVQTWPPKEK